MFKPSLNVFSFAVLFAALALLSSLSATAQESVGSQSFSVSLEAINNSILIDGQAAFELTIENHDNYAETFRISMPDIEWSVTSDPLYHYFSGFDVPSFGSQKVKLFLKPTVAFPPGLRNVRITVESVKGKEEQTISTFVNIRSSYQLLQEYLAAVSRIVEIPALVDPRGEFEIKVNLINRNPKNISSLKVRLSSVSTSLITEEALTGLKPLESKSVSTRVKLDPLTAPVQDTLRVVLYVDDKPLEPTIFEKFEVIGYSELKTVKSERTGSFFRWVNKTTYVNEGNVKLERVVEHKTSFLKSLFTRTSPKAFSISKGGVKYNAWELSLEPQETITLQEVESYRSIFYMVVLAFVVFVLYRFFQSPVRLIKEASAISYKEGGVSELKVILRIKNRSSKPYVKITLMDRVPMIAEVEHDSMGTLKPATIFNDGKGTVVKWELENIEKHEERILAYKVRSKLSILGAFTLPKSSARFFTEQNVKFVTHSNTVVIKP